MRAGWSVKPSADLAPVLRKIALDHRQREPRQNRGGRLALEQELERGFEQPLRRDARRVTCHVLGRDGHLVRRRGASWSDDDSIKCDA